MTQKVSIMMPVYNGLPLIKASIQSLLNQTYQNWECIIIDDGSTDGTSEYIDTLIDKRFQICHFDKNYGRPIARQKALDLADGDFLAMLDAGDLYHPQKLELQLLSFNENPSIDLVSSKICSFGTKTDVLYGRGKDSGKVISYGGKNVPPHGPSMIRMTVAKQFKYNPMMKVGQDTDFLQRLLNGRRYYMYPDFLYFYSEFDSVNKKKIRQGYRLNTIRDYKCKEWKNMIISGLKYLISITVFPFIPIETILSKRGEKIEGDEKENIMSVILPLINVTLNK